MIPLEAAPAGYQNVVKFVPLKNITIRDLTIDGTDCAAADKCRAIFGTYLADSTFAHLKLDTLVGAAISLKYGYNLTFENIHVNDSGSGGVGADEHDLQFMSISNSVFRDITSTKAKGWGPGWWGSTNNRVSNITASGGMDLGRGVSVGSALPAGGGAAWNQFNNISVNNFGSVCLAIRGGSYRNQITNIIAHDCKDSEGVWFGDQDVQYNLLANVTAYNNTTSDLGISNTDNNNMIQNFSGATVTDNGTNNSISTGTLVSRGDPAAADKVVGDLTVDAGWHDLDLSAIVPAGANMILLRVDVTNNTAAQYVQFREKGQAQNSNSALVFAQVAAIKTSQNITVMCNAARVIQYLASNGGVFASLDITVRGWQ